MMIYQRINDTQTTHGKVFTIWIQSLAAGTSVQSSYVDTKLDTFSSYITFLHVVEPEEPWREPEIEAFDASDAKREFSAARDENYHGVRCICSATSDDV